MTMDRTGRKHFTASGLIEHQGRFLVLFHQKLGLWLYPGGHIEENEEPQDALVREIQEETEISVSVLSCELLPEMRLELPAQSVKQLEQPLSILCEMIPEKSGGHHWHIDLIYLCEANADDLWRLEKRSDIRWVTPDELAQLPCPAELPSLMNKALAACAGLWLLLRKIANEQTEQQRGANARGRKSHRP